MFSEIQNQHTVEIISFILTFTVILGHNLWLITEEKPVKKTQIKINTGDDFPDGEVAIKPERIKDFRVFTEDGNIKIDEFHVENTSLTASFNGNSEAGFAAAIELFPHPITLEASKFAHYITDEQAEISTQPDFTVGETVTPQRESYAKFAKVLVGDRPDIFTFTAGHQLEIVLLEKLSGGLKVQVVFGGQPAPNLRISSGREGISGGRYLQHTRTDENGIAEIEITQNGHWYLRTHLIRRHPDQESFEWESFWASITFRYSL